MKPDRWSGWWRALALGAYMAEKVRRGDDGALRDAMVLPRHTLGWWFTAAALFALRRDGLSVDLAGLSVSSELKRAEQEIEDWLHQLEVMTALVRALAEAATPAHRAALAAYLRLLHRCDLRDARIRLAAKAGECLPQPHAQRLLRWAKARLEHRTPSNINLYHTPPALAAAFARTGDLAGALDTIRYTEEHSYFRPKATIDLIGSFELAGAEDRRGEAAATLARLAGWSPEERLQILSAAYDWLDKDQRAGVIELLQAHRLSLGADLPVLRCRVLAALALYARPSDADHREFLRLADFASAYERDTALAILAEKSATAGHADLALNGLAAIGSDWLRTMAWGRAIAVACEPAIKPLLRALAGDSAQAHQVLDDSSTNRELLDAVTGMSAELLPLLETLGLEDHGGRSELLAAAAVRAFELGAIDLAQRALLQSGNLFDRSRCLPPSAGREPDAIY